MKLSQWVRPRFSVLIFGAFVLLWLIFAPVQLGGNTAYVIVNGSSMAPEFRFGDLVIVNQVSHYFVGDVVAYTDPKIGPVFHRIIDYYGDQFILKGDDNHWIDPHYPASDEVIGKFWVRLPGIGKYIRVLREPINYTFMVVVFIGITFFPKKPQKPRRGKRMKLMKVLPRMALQERFYEIVIVIGVVAVFTLGFVIFSFSKPTTQLIDRQLILNHGGSFEYTAEAVVGVYDEQHASTGEPIFLNISDTIEVQFDYVLGTSEVLEIHGTYEVIAQINDDTGWKRTFTLTPTTDFEGDSFTVPVSLYIPRFNRVIARFKQITGVALSTFDLTVIPRIQLVGNYDTQEIRNQFSPTLNFQMNESMIRMSFDEDDPDPFTVTEVSSISVPDIEANTVSFFAWQIPVLTIRILSSLILIAVLAVGGWYGWEMVQVAQKSEYEQVVFYYGDQIVNLKKGPKFEKVIEVETFKALVNLAKNFSVKILHIYQRKQHHFYVTLEDGVFLYKTDGGEAS